MENKAAFNTFTYVDVLPQSEGALKKRRLCVLQAAMIATQVKSVAGMCLVIHMGNELAVVVVTDVGLPVMR
jgi:hypothetical protein